MACRIQYSVLLLAALSVALAHAGSPRFARLGSFEGSVEVQWDAADSWRPASVNLPLPESTRIRTGPAAKVEIEFDDTAVFRMVGEGLAELSDYTRLSGGQLVTVISLDRGLAYFTGDPGTGSSIHLLMPGAQASLKQGSRIRLNALDTSSEIAIIEGAARFTMPSAEMDLRQGQSARVTVPDSTHFSLFREITPLETDRWSEQLDKAEAQAPGSRLDLDRAGKWITDGDYGTVWQPTPRAGWAPFREGRWVWYQSVGYTWVGSESWGWKPYHEGRWLQHHDLGWVWVPDTKSAGFLPGDVFWARSANSTLWGPLAPGEPWGGSGPPRQFAALNVTGGTFVSGAREILPSSAEDLPKDLLKAFLFTAALPSPPLPVTRLTAAREPLRTKLYSALEVSPELRPITKATPPPPPPADAPPVVAETAPLPSEPVIAPDPVPAGPPAVVVPGIVAIRSHDRSSTRRPDAPNPGAVRLTGAGSPGPAQLYQQWFQEFNKAKIDYQPGQGGLKELTDGKIDFAATDIPGVDAKLLHFPSAVTAVVPVYNVPGIYDGLKLTPDVLAAIYLGEIRYWNDPRIRSLNPRASVPPTPIILVHRSDASATTNTLTDYLSKVSPAWKKKFGASASIEWPVKGLAGKGDEGVAAVVQQTLYSLGYVEFAWAAKNRMPTAAVKNRAGHFVFASLENLTSAAASAMPMDGTKVDFRASITDSPGHNAYPIAAFTYLVVPPQGLDSSRADPRKATAMWDFLRWMMTDGQSETSGFDYASLPPEVVTLEHRQLSLTRRQW